MHTTSDILRRTDLPGHEAKRLLAMVTGRSVVDVGIGVPLDDDQVSRYTDLEVRRLDGQPLQYLEGSIPFGPVTISVDERVLIPRPETEELFTMVRGLADEPAVIVDLCTGSGNLAVALAAAFPGATVYGADVSADALSVAAGNAETNGVSVSFHLGDLFDALPRDIEGSVDLLVANPPYLAESELDGLATEVRREPVIALVSGPRGDEVVARIAAAATQWLAPGGVVACEVSEFHAQSVVPLFATVDGRICTDMYGKDRFVVGRRRVE
ncbi:MAG TPA: peptide chain release factor N(5)-glutamine methyltransferase [Acidimicrobiia bacterium]|nr:peptide chain release factor N(5)-glutamine methyltransferase [Acidimicrobiia bacterium]